MITLFLNEGSARLSFEQSPYFAEVIGKETYSTITLDLIHHSARRALAIFSKELVVAAPGQPPPFGAYPLYQAIVLQHRLAQGTNAMRYTEAVKILKDALQYMSKRWKVAGLLNPPVSPKLRT